MRIGQVAESSGVTVEALRFYERRGLLPAPARTSSGYRDYPTRTVDRECPLLAGGLPADA